MKVFKLATGLAIGYVLGSRAGRDKYEQIVAAARKAQNHPAVTQVQDKAKQLLGSTGTASSSDAAAEQVTMLTSEANDPALRSSRRQPKTSVTDREMAIDPLA